jgi:hypothetical protein
MSLRPSFRPRPTSQARLKSPYVNLCIACLLLIGLVPTDTWAWYPLMHIPLAWGIYEPNAPSTASALDDVTHEVGARPAMVMWYQDWVHESSFQTAEMEAVLTRGAVPMLTWEPWDNTLGTAYQPKYRLANIVRGDFDPFVRQWATEARKLGKPIYLRFGQEMNGDWYSWGTGRANPNGNAPADFVAAWKHVHAVFKAVGADNVRWVWSPNIDSAGSTPYQYIYPGDSFVDWVGLDGYNVGGSGGAWRSLYDIFHDSYFEVGHITSKPLMIAETASSSQGGDKAAWITQALTKDLPNLLPRVRAVIWFNEDKGVNWRLDSTASSLAAFGSAIASPAYQAKLST